MIEEMVVSRKRRSSESVASSRSKRSKINSNISDNVMKGRLTRRREYRDEVRDEREDNSKFDSSDDEENSGGYDSSGKGMEDYRREIQNKSRRNESCFDDSNEQEEVGHGFESDPHDEVEEGDKEQEDRSKRQMELIRVYSQGTQLLKNDTTLRTLTKSLRKLIIPHVKFVQCSKVFGSFDQPDFTSADCWQNKLFSNIPSLHNARGEMKAQVWMTYRSKLKEQFSLHRSGVTLKIKRKFEEGKWVSCSELHVAT